MSSATCSSTARRLSLSCEVADHLQPDVGPVEAVDQHQRVLHAQALLDFVAHRGRGGGGEADDGRVAQLPADLAEAQVVGAEVVAPRGDAVRLVHHEQRDVQGREPLHGFGLGQLLGRQEDEDGVAAFGGFPGGVHLGIAAAGVDGDGGFPAEVFQQAVQLVLLQGDQRGNDDGGTGRRAPDFRRGRRALLVPAMVSVQVQRGHLVDGRLAVAGGHHGEDVPAGGKGAHSGELAVPEVGRPKVPAASWRRPASGSVVLAAGLWHAGGA